MSLLSFEPFFRDDIYVCISLFRVGSPQTISISAYYADLSPSKKFFSRQLSPDKTRKSHLDFPEYDVQDLLHGLLRIDFDDVRPEEWTPSYAGASNRMDFLLKEDEIAIEVKMTRNGLKDKELGEQLIIDIAKYQSHPNCKCLYCYVYDPEGNIRNPRGLEKDLAELGKGFRVKVFIRPE